MSDVCTATPAAVEQIKKLLERNSDACGLRLRVVSKGCSGLRYHLEYAHEKDNFDEEVVLDGLSVLVEGKSLPYVIGIEIDYAEGRLESGFVFNNPNETARCGCGESFRV